MKNKTYCVIMAGGVGSRFWPMSRNDRPKQFLDILGTGKTFLQSTYERFLPLVPESNFLVVTNSAYADLVRKQLPQLPESNILAEPMGRNTAPCIAYAAFRLNAMDPDSVMIVTPSDHLVSNESEFGQAIQRSVDYLEGHDTLMTIGIRPDHPNTGYGYIQTDSKCGINRICPVKTFTEKPGYEMAKVFVESGEFLWNSGIFIWKTNRILQEIEELLPDTYHLFDSIGASFGTDREKENILEIYPQCRAISIDFGIMEKTDDVHVYNADFGWSDIGTWESLYRYSPKDAEGNVVPEQSKLYDTKNCIIKVPKDKMVVVEGLENFIVVDEGDILMICPRENEKNIKKFIDEVKYDHGDKFV